MIGRLRDRLSIMEVSILPDGIGGTINTIEEVFVCWCAARFLTGSASFNFRTVYNSSPIEFTIRTGSYPLTTENTLEWNGEKFTIHSITTDPLNRFTKIIAYM